jgi:tubulin polyglutamylase TTLL2
MPMVFRTDTERGMPNILRDVLLSLGWVEYDDAVPAEAQLPFNLFWRINRFTASQIQSAQYPHQRISHYPKSSEITKKDHLYRHLRRMRVVHGSCYDFSPVTFGLPNDYVKFCQYYAAEREKWEADVEARKQELRRAGGSDEAHVAQLREGPRHAPTYICKPSDLSRGRKIFVFREISELTYDCSSIVQRYIERPLLIHGHKIDFRVYVLVTSFQPLRAYIFDDLLGRFSVEKYDLGDVSNIFSHLTNYSVNKNSSIFEQHKAGIGTGCKWHSGQIREHFAKSGIEWDVLWRRVEVLVCYTLLSIASIVTPFKQCFELYGFDIMFDESFKPWLIEVNFSPALAVESEVDDRVKRALMLDMIDTLNIPETAGCASPPDPSPAATATPPVSAAAPTAAGKRADAGRKPQRQQTPLGPSGRPSQRASPPPPPAVTASLRPEDFVDAPKGNFRWCFPFSPETTKFSEQMTPNHPGFDQAVRMAIGEVKKREARIVAEMADFPARYGTADPVAAASAVGSPPPTAGRRGSTVTGDPSRSSSTVEPVSAAPTGAATAGASTITVAVKNAGESLPSHGRRSSNDASAGRNTRVVARAPPGSTRSSAARTLAVRSSAAPAAVAPLATSVATTSIDIEALEAMLEEARRIGT